MEISIDMDLTVEQFVNKLLSDEASEEPSDKVKVEELEAQMKLPEWFDEKKYNQARRFMSDFLFGFATCIILGLMSTFCIPSIMNIFLSTRRSSSTYTAYMRFTSTTLHSFSWLIYDLKPGTITWRSLHTVRVRHLKAGRAGKLKNIGTVSQRDLSLLLLASMAYIFLKPDKFGVRQLQEGDWEAVNHFMRVIGNMVGIQDRYNVYRPTFKETREVFQIIFNRVFTPCLENVPEYFEHMNHVAIDGLKKSVYNLEITSMLFLNKYLADVPGYIYTEDDRLKLQEKLNKLLKGKSFDTGVDTTALMGNCAIKGLPGRPPRLLFLRDYDTLETSPTYKNLPFIGKYKLALMHYILIFNSTYIGRTILNLYFRFLIFFVKYFPFVGMWKFGIKKAFVDMFKDGPTEDVVLKPNSEYTKPPPSEPWYKCILAILW